MSDPDDGDERVDRAGSGGEESGDPGTESEDPETESSDPGSGSGDSAGDGETRSDRAGDLQSVVDREVEEIQGKMAEIRDRMEEVSDELDERWTTDADRTPDGPTDPDEIVERLGKWKTSADEGSGDVEDTPASGDTGDPPEAPGGREEGPGAPEDESEGSGEATEPPDESGEDDAGE